MDEHGHHPSKLLLDKQVNGATHRGSLRHDMAEGWMKLVLFFKLFILNTFSLSQCEPLYDLLPQYFIILHNKQSFLPPFCRHNLSIASLDFFYFSATEL